MSKIKCQIKSKALIFKFLALDCDIHLRFGFWNLDLERLWATVVVMKTKFWNVMWSKS